MINITDVVRLFYSMVGTQPANERSRNLPLAGEVLSRIQAIAAGHWRLRFAHPPHAR
jgi:hypothetical protein